MTRHLRIFLCVLAAAAIGFGIAGYGTQQSQAQAQKKSTAVAVVNVAELIAKSDKNTQFQADMQKRRTRLQQESEEKQQKINTMKLDLDVIVDAQDRAKKIREITKAAYEFQAWSQIEQQNMLRDQQMFLIELYGDIDRTVAAIAKREGYDLVLFDTPVPDFEKLNPDQLVTAIGNRRVIFREKRVNMTPIVLDQMNLDYLNRGGDN